MEKHYLLKKNDWSLITVAAGDPPTPAGIDGSLDSRYFQKEILIVKMNVAKESEDDFIFTSTCYIPIFIKIKWELYFTNIFQGLLGVNSR